MKNSMNKIWVVTAVLMLGTAGCAGTATQDSTGQYIDDASITTKVKSDLLADKDVSSMHISVDTVKGEVHLTGTADSRQEADKAGRIARDVAGVKSVDNDIHVK
ncbi:MAG: BON domain-containing protein [Sulfuricaulis sp.]